MRILILSQWYWPEPAPRPHTLARHLAERGHEVTAITGFPNYPSGTLYSGYHQKLWQWQEQGGVRILRVPLYPSHDRSSIRRAQINGRNAISWEEKFALDVWYGDHYSLWLDLRIILLTALKVLRRDGISAEGEVTMPEFKGPSYDET